MKLKMIISALAAIAMMCCAVANAQVLAADDPIDSWRAPFSTGVSYSVSMQLEAVNAAGNLALVGTAVKFQVDLLHSPVLVDLPGNKASALTVSAIRATFTATGGIGWEQVQPFAVRHRFSSPMVVPAAVKVGCRYDAPIQTFDVLTLSFGAPGPGRIQCQPGQLASTIPAPIAAAPPAPIPTPQPLPPPVAAGCVLMPPAPSLTDSGGHIFTALAGSGDAKANEIGIAMDGVQQFGAVLRAYLVGGQVCVDDSQSPGALGPLVCFVNGKQQAAPGPAAC